MGGAVGAYFLGVKRACASNSYVAVVRGGKEGELLRVLREKVQGLEDYEGAFCAGTYRGCRLVYYARSGRLLVEPPEGVDATSVLEELLSGA